MLYNKGNSITGRRASHKKDNNRGKYIRKNKKYA
jgi:hypothetical protein